MLVLRFFEEYTMRNVIKFHIRILDFTKNVKVMAIYLNINHGQLISK